MKVKQKDLLWSSLPSAKDKKKIMAANGMFMEPGPKSPGLRNAIKTLPYDYFDTLQASMPQAAPMPGTPPDTNKIPLPGPNVKPPGLVQPVQPKRQQPNFGNAALLGLSAIDALIPQDYNKQTVVQPQMSYNPYSYGTGSQALMDYGGYIEEAKSGIHIKKSKRGTLHDALGIPRDKPIPTSRLADKPGDSSALKKKKNFARNARKWNHENGGIIPDNMSVFNPHEYDHGGMIKEVGPNYPNTDLLEQIIQYCGAGGALGPGILEQFIKYDDGGSLSSSKAREMLKDGTANGKKLTKKQKKYFGMVAAGKAEDGLFVGDPDPKKPLPAPNPDPLNRNKTRVYQGATTGDAKFAMEQDTRNLSSATDLINQNIASGLLPNQTATDADLRTAINPKLYSYLYQFNQRSDLKGLNPEQRVKLFYDLQSDDADVQAMKSRLKTQGYGPTEFYRTNTIGAAQPTTAVASTMNNGGVMYNDGGAMDTMWGGNVEMASYNPYDGGMAEFKGASHENGGIGMHYNGQPAEVEGGEFASKDSDGNLNIYGNMYLPGTKTKFKTVAKEMANKERRYDYLKTEGSKLVDKANPADKFEQLSFNAGQLMMKGGQIGQADLAQKKQNLSSLQRAMLDTADEFGLDPQHLSKGRVKKAKGGASIPFYDNGGETDPNDPSRSDRNNNPGNIKYGKFAKKYGAKKDKDGFAIFPTKEVGMNAMQTLLKSPTYKDLTVREAIKKWTGGKPYNYNLGRISSTKVDALSADQFGNVIDTMVKGEGTRYGSNVTAPPIRPGTPNIAAPPTVTPYGLPDVPLTPTPETKKPGTVEPPYDKLNPPPQRGVIPSDVEPLHLNQLLGEIYGMATNHVEPVPAQRYDPQLYVPYQVSFQDRINQNQNNFSAIQRAVGANNPSALGALAGQTYEANNAVRADEFRANQGISNDITNKNIALVNDAELKNLGIADTQMVRQSQARSNTRAMNQMIVNSVSGKYAQNELENKRLAAYENLYDYRFVPQKDGGLKATYYGPNAMFNFNGNNSQGTSDIRTVSRYDASGNLKGYSEYDDYDLREQQRAIDLETKRRKLPLLGAPKLN